MRVWKYSLDIKDGYQIVKLPSGAQVLHVGQQALDAVAIWVKIDPDAEREERQFLVAGTGQRIEPGLEYHGTVQSAFHGLVWHVFEKKRVRRG